MYLEENIEVEELIEKAEYFAARHPSLIWIPTCPDVLYELKSEKTFCEADAMKHYYSIIENEHEANHKAITVNKSRYIADAWRVVINLEEIERWQL